MCHNFFGVLISSLLIMSAESYSGDRYKGRVIRPEPRFSPLKVPPKNCEGAMCEAHHNRMQRIHSIKKCQYGICEESPIYPVEVVERMIKENKNMHSFFGKVIEPYKPVTFESRFKGESDELCESLRRTVYPVEMMDLSKEPRYIANRLFNEEYSQAVIFEVCSQQGKSCFVRDILNYSTQCIQKYNIIKLVTLSKNMTHLEYARFSIPSTCVCVIQREIP